MAKIEAPTLGEALMSCVKIPINLVAYSGLSVGYGVTWGIEKSSGAVYHASGAAKRSIGKARKNQSAYLRHNALTVACKVTRKKNKTETVNIQKGSGLNILVKNTVIFTMLYQWKNIMIFTVKLLTNC